MAGRDPPPFLNTEDDRGAIVAVVSFTFITVSTLTNGIRVWIRRRSEGAFGLDDALLVAANLIAIVQTVLVGASITHGLGRHFDTLSDVSRADYYKFSYSSSILAIISMGFAKFSVLQLQRRICGIQSADRYMKVMYWALAGVILAWTLFSVFALAFQCGTTAPHMYEPDRCLNGVLWYPVAVTNAVTDAALAFSFTPVILKLATKKRMKVRVMVLLGTRTLVCIATIVQIASFAQGLTGLDQTRAMMKPVILQQIVLNLSILTAVMLSLHGFIVNLTAGRFGVQVRQLTNDPTNGSYSTPKRPLKASNAVSRQQQDSSRTRSVHDPQPPRTGRDSMDLRPDRVNNNAWARHEGSNGWEDSDDRKSDSSQENIIKQTVTWQVSSNNVASSSSPRADETASRGEGEVLQTLSPNAENHAATTRNFLT